MVRMGCTSRSRSASAREPAGHPPPEDRGVAAALAAVLGALCQGAGLGRALAAHDRSRLDQAARGRLRDRADRDHGRRVTAMSIARASPTGMRSSMALPSRPSTACCRYRILPARWRRRAPQRCRIRGRPRSSAPSRRSGRGRWPPAPAPRRNNPRRARPIPREQHRCSDMTENPHPVVRRRSAMSGSSHYCFQHGNWFFSGLKQLK